MTNAFVFPGQGSQSVGMGKGLADAFPESRAVFDAVDDALGEKLSSLIWDGPESELTLTRNAQPALMAVSIAALRALEALRPRVIAGVDDLGGAKRLERRALTGRTGGCNDARGAESAGYLNGRSANAR